VLRAHYEAASTPKVDEAEHTAKEARPATLGDAPLVMTRSSDAYHERARAFVRRVPVRAALRRVAAERRRSDPAWHAPARVRRASRDARGRGRP